MLAVHLCGDTKGEVEPVPLGFQVMVWLFCPGPGLNFDFSTFNFHVPVSIFRSDFDWPRATMLVKPRTATTTNSVLVTRYRENAGPIARGGDSLLVR